MIGRRRAGTALGPVVALALALGLGLSGCGKGLEDVPLPSLVSGPTHEMTAVFDSALNLPDQAPVKLEGATVGQVARVEVHDYRAHVVMDVMDGTVLREGTRAQIRLTSPMGTAFVELSDGDGEALPAGSVIAVADTTTAPDVADLLSALSVVVTGGSFGDVKTIIDELNTILGGRTGRIRDLMDRTAQVMADLSARTDDFDRTLRGLDRLGRSLAADSPFLLRAVEDLSPTVRALESQRGDLVRLLKALRRFGDTSREVVTASRADLVTTLQQLDPVLAGLQRSQEHLVPIMRGLVAFGDKTQDATPGDYSNFDLTFELDPDSLTPREGDDPPLDALLELLGLDGIPGELGGLGGLLPRTGQQEASR